MAGAGPQGSPDARGADDTGLYPALVARLREAGLDPDVEQLRDALWLARWARHPDAPPEDDEVRGSAPPVRPPPERADERPPAPEADAAEPAPGSPDDEPPPRRDPGEADRVTLYPVPRTGSARRGRPGARAEGVQGAARAPSPSVCPPPRHFPPPRTPASPETVAALPPRVAPAAQCPRRDGDRRTQRPCGRVDHPGVPRCVPGRGGPATRHGRLVLDAGVGPDVRRTPADIRPVGCLPGRPGALSASGARRCRRGQPQPRAGRGAAELRGPAERSDRPARHRPGQRLRRTALAQRTGPPAAAPAGRPGTGRRAPAAAAADVEPDQAAGHLRLAVPGRRTRRSRRAEGRRTAGHGPRRAPGGPRRTRPPAGRRGTGGLGEAALRHRLGADLRRGRLGAGRSAAWRPRSVRAADSPRSSWSAASVRRPHRPPDSSPSIWPRPRCICR